MTSDPLVKPMPSELRSTFQQYSPAVLTWKKLVTRGIAVPLLVELKSSNEVGFSLTLRNASTVAAAWCESIQTGHERTPHASTGHAH